MLDKPKEPPLTNNEGDSKCSSNVDNGVADGLGTGKARIGVATMSENENEESMQGRKNVDKQMNQEATNAAKLAIGLATGLGMCINENEVIMKNLNGVKSSAGSPKTTTNKKHFKSWPPRMAQKMAENCRRVPPIKTKLTNLTPLKAKTNYLAAPK